MLHEKNRRLMRQHDKKLGRLKEKYFQTLSVRAQTSTVPIAFDEAMKVRMWNLLSHPRGIAEGGHFVEAARQLLGLTFDTDKVASYALTYSQAIAQIKRWQQTGSDNDRFVAASTSGRVGALETGFLMNVIGAPD